MKNKVYIAGAGSGDIGNLTVKVYEIIQNADVILYDNLVSDEIILLSKKTAILVDVGKISGYHKLKQDEINSLLVQYAQKYKIVLRLKGGDPYIFGRGGEEALYLFENNVDYEVLPGISSIGSVPASFGIPLTHRDLSSSFYIVTGRKKNSKTLDENDFINLSNMKNTTLVFLMSTNIYDKIAKGLINAGKSPDTKSVILSRGTTAKAKKFEYSLLDLSNIKDMSIFETPSILLVGDVVSLSEKLSPTPKLLTNKRFILNIPRKKNDYLIRKLRENGAQVVNLSTNLLEKNYDKMHFTNIIKSIKAYDYLCFSSTYAVDVFFEILSENNFDIRDLYNVKICAVGPSTSNTLRNRNIICDLIPQNYDAKTLANQLIKLDAKNVVCILPHKVQSDLYDLLHKHNIKVERLDIYSSTIGKVRLYNEEDDDIFVFTSSYGVLGLVESYKKNHFTSKLAFCIGEKTKQTAEKFGFKTLVAEKSTYDELLDLICKFYSKN
ncbi:uroporphyrinogen-III C-methyltransferase [[Eubacterium] yurii subsp. margaretiae ATCC 43715]|nr:uroporphyrinogen-III C-methyltransferase [[Eubacterium] yurii subsp. margaretiae ATCC 43715]